ncbi:hypothetical protein B5M09_008702 [Aphanomyces astaci]|uniref:Uncharacterized protein n=1 Tax=Aphanomyces astaci TaxID=112090 RepID=A0A425CRF4_APHAT|nr:hypothetical protein B5M09_008702 [Aphanomyces astaci]
MCGLACESHDLPLHAHPAVDNRLRRSSLVPGDVVFRHVTEVVKPRDRVVEHQHNTTAAVRWVVNMGGDIVGVNARVIHGNEIFAMSDCVLVRDSHAMQRHVGRQVLLLHLGPDLSAWPVFTCSVMLPRPSATASAKHTKAAFVPTPADAIEAILFELTDRVDILAKINLARPYTPKVAMARFTVDTGDALANQSHEAIMSSLFASTQTDTVKSLLSEFVQVTRLGRGGIMVSVTSSNALKTLGGQYMSIMGKKYIIPVHEEHPLDPLCFMDITGIRDNFDATQFYHKLTQLGVDVVYHSVCAVLPGTGCHTNTWRVYFTDAAIPAQLQINGEPINQIKYQRFYYRVYFKGTKGTAFRSFNGGSTHCVDIEAKR